MSGHYFPYRQCVCEVAIYSCFVRKTHTQLKIIITVKDACLCYPPKLQHITCKHIKSNSIIALTYVKGQKGNGEYAPI